MNILVTGASGFIGSAIVRRLVDDGESVHILRRESSRLDLLDDLTTAVEHRKGDVTAIDTLFDALTGIDAVFHVAGFVGFGGPDAQRLLVDVNVKGTANVVDAALAAGVSRLVLTSSVAAIGRPDAPGEIIDEGLEWRPSKANTAYAQSKYRAELEVHRGIAEGLDAVIVNPSLVFGKCREDEGTGRIVTSIRDGRLPGYPEGSTNVVDVLDVADGHVRALHAGGTGNRYLLGSENLSWQEIFSVLATAFDVKPPTRPIPTWLATAGGALLEGLGRISGTEPRLTRELARVSGSHWRYSNRRAREALSMTFRPFEETARRLANAFSAS